MPTCSGCPYHVPEDEDDTCHIPRGAIPPKDALCYDDVMEGIREAAADTEAHTSPTTGVMDDV